MSTLPPASRTSHRLLKGAAVLTALALAAVVMIEVRTSALQAGILTRLQHDFHAVVQAGPSPSIEFPAHGSYDRRLGYTAVPAFAERLSTRGFGIGAQARQSTALAEYIAAGHHPPFDEKAQPGVQVLACDATAVAALPHPSNAYTSFDAVPPLVARTVLFIEDRELLAPHHPTSNPALEPSRLMGGLVDDTAGLLRTRLPGADRSTLALRTETRRHAPEGRPATWPERWRLLVSASVRAYRDGEDTSAVRRRIVLDHLNGMPLGEWPGRGEVIGLRDGLAAWYGTDPAGVDAALREDGLEPERGLRERGRAYRQVLSLLIAQRHPEHYLAEGQGRMATLADRYLHLLAREGVIDPALRDAALNAWEAVREPRDANPPAALHLAEAPAATAAGPVLDELAELLPMPSPQALERLDLAVSSTIDGRLQQAVAALLDGLRDPSTARAAGLVGDGQLEAADVARIDWRFTLVERGADGLNRVRVRAAAGPSAPAASAAEASRLELGATAKLRTLASYLEAVAALHGRLGQLDAAALGRLDVHPGDPLTRWAVDHLTHARDNGLPTMLEAAMQRRYSASPAETFFTGGGVQRFANLRRADDARTPTVAEALRDSVNLVFVRLMRDLVHHHAMRSGGRSRVLAGADRSAHLAFASHHDVVPAPGPGMPRWQGLVAALEADAFAEIHRSWRRTGYPFDSLPPSYGSAIGDAGDRPDALADLLGVIVNDGRRQPTTHIESLRFAGGTPYETVLRREPTTGEAVMAPEVAAVLRDALKGVVEHGVGQPLRGAFEPLAAGGQAGGGDGDAGQAATFVFFVGDRHFGSVTAHLRGGAGAARLPSVLPVQVLRSIVPLLQDVMHEPAGACPQLANATPPAPGGAVRVHAVPPARSPARAASPST